MQKSDQTAAPRRSRRRSPRVPLILVASAVLIASVAGASMGYRMRFNLPDVRALEDYAPPVTTRVFSADGSVLDTFAEQHRMLVQFRDIPENFTNALLATEDSNFYNHPGIDLRGIARAAWKDLRELKLEEGASTITQQLARNLFLHRDKTVRRKIQEALLALEIERQYTKQEILRYYANQIYTGHGRYGIEAASRFYFGVPAREMNLTQAATLAGLLQRPESLSPVRHPERARDRRNHVLRRMETVGYIDSETAAEARDQPLDVAQQRSRADLAPFFVEEVRRWLQQKFGSSSLYNEGLEVRTTLDPVLQSMANRAVETGLRELDKRQGWRGAQERVPVEEDPATWDVPSWESAPRFGLVHDGVVLSADKKQAVVRVGPFRGALAAKQISWTGEKFPSKILQAGDIIRVKLIDAPADGPAQLALEQEPLVEAAVIVLRPSDGEILALVGGYDFGRSEFNRAIQAKRQTGSAFKPFVYAAALGAGWTLADTLVDEPTVFLDPRKPEPYQPENYTNKYYGTLTLRTALERSANIATVKLLDQIGYRPVIDTARRLGMSGNLRPFASLALGAFESNLVELTAAYGAFANEGVLVEPHLVREVIDREGAVVATAEPDVHDAVTPQIAYLMNRLLSGVISDGTGRAAKSIRLHLAGKTGTTDDNTDAWFIGYSPDIAVGVWVGFDEPKTLGKKETGAMAALPIWRSLMEQAVPLLPYRDFPMPPGVTMVSIDRRSGHRADRRAYCNPVISEVFLEGTEPTEVCSVYQHQRLRLPHPFHKYSLNDQGELVIPARELDALLERETTARLVEGGRRLEVYKPDETVSMPIQIVPGGDIELPDPRLEQIAEEFDVDPETWIGKDGRKARIIWIDGRPALRASR